MVSLKALAFFDNALIGVVLVLFWLSIKTCDDTERFAVFRGKKLLGLKGPGPFFRIPLYDTIHRVTLGNLGTMEHPGTARFNGVKLPVTVPFQIEQGTAVEIIGFEQDQNGFSRIVASVKAHR